MGRASFHKVGRRSWDLSTRYFRTNINSRYVVIRTGFFSPPPFFSLEPHLFFPPSLVSLSEHSKASWGCFTFSRNQSIAPTRLSLKQYRIRHPNLIRSICSMVSCGRYLKPSIHLSVFSVSFQIPQTTHYQRGDYAVTLPAYKVRYRVHPIMLFSSPLGCRS